MDSLMDNRQWVSLFTMVEMISIELFLLDFFIKRIQENRAFIFQFFHQGKVFFCKKMIQFKRIEINRMSYANIKQIITSLN